MPNGLNPNSLGTQGLPLTALTLSLNTNTALQYDARYLIDLT